MRVRIPGDFAVPVAFGCATGLLLALNLMATTAEPGTAPAAKILGVLYSVVTFVSFIAACFGRRLPDGATYYWWGDVGRDWFAVIGGAALLYFGGMMVVWSLMTQTEVGPVLLTVAFGIGFLWLAYMFLLRVRFVAFTQDKTILTFSGKPIIFRRQKFRCVDFTSLEVRTDRAYAGTLGMITTWQRQYDVYAVSPTSKVHIGRSTSEKTARQNLIELTKLTGLPAGEFPIAGGSDITRSVTG